MVCFFVPTTTLVEQQQNVFQKYVGHCVDNKVFFFLNFLLIHSQLIMYQNIDNNLLKKFKLLDFFKFILIQIDQIMLKLIFLKLS